MAQNIEVYLQPPSPKREFKLPSVDTLFSSEEEKHNINDQGLHAPLPSIQLPNSNTNRLKTIEPQLSIKIEYEKSPVMQFSSPLSSSVATPSPILSPIIMQDSSNNSNYLSSSSSSSFLLPPPENAARRCRSVSNASSTCSSPCLSPQLPSLRSLSEPPTLFLISNENIKSRYDEENDEGNHSYHRGGGGHGGFGASLSCGEEDEDDEEEEDVEQIKSGSAVQTEDYHTVFGKKRKRGRPTNASRPEVQSDSHWTFVKPTVWDVKSNNERQLRPSSSENTHPTISPPEDKQDGINTFRCTNMEISYSIPRKKRGRKPKKQIAGNSCFVWRDLTAPRGANKKLASSSATKKNLIENRVLLPAIKKD
ncbi:hypothetical protein K501DRAFT_288790 [Backusella circina FSU 941]|nr:hypothetical protein K501DRAFT_288790 [Backusella circina FSU 941]